VGGANTIFFLAAHFAKQNTKFGGGGKKLELESEGGQKFLPPNPLPFCPPERLDFKIRNSDFRQKKFEHQSKNTATHHGLKA
jgi:hypothetical protein